MTGPPAARLTRNAETVDPSGPKDTPKVSSYVRVTNPARNGPPYLRRKDAEHYVTVGRAVWLRCEGPRPERVQYAGGLLVYDQVRLLDSHPKNRAAAVEAAAGYRRAAAVMVRRPEELLHLPVLLPRIALTDRRVRGYRHIVGRSGPVRAVQRREAAG